MVVEITKLTRKHDLTSIFHHFGICRDERETEQVFQHMCQIAITETQAVESGHCLSQTAAWMFQRSPLFALPKQLIPIPIYKKNPQILKQWKG